MEKLMREARIAAATKVATELFKTECAIDELLACAARLSAALPQARISANLSGVMGQSAVESAAQLVSTIVSARGVAVTLHGQLNDLKNDMGLRTLGMGGGMYKGPLASGENDVENIVPLRPAKAA
jgi:hypothetical protein